MSQSDTAAAKNLCRLFDLENWPEHNFRKFPLISGQVTVWLNYESETECLKLESVVGECPSDFNSEWLNVLLSAGAYNGAGDESWLGLRRRSILFRGVCFPAYLSVDGLAEKLGAFTAIAQAWRDLLTTKNLAVTPAEALN